MAAKRKNGLFDALTRKRVTYHRDVKGERAELERAAAANKRAAADRAAEVQQEYAYRVGSSHKRAGRRPLTAFSSVMTAAAEKALGKTKALAIATRAYKEGFRENPAGRPNPEGGAAAAAKRLTAAFLGRPSEKATTYTQNLKYEGKLSDLARLMALEIVLEQTPGGAVKTKAIKFRGDVRLSSNPKGTQLYIIGGDQSLDLREFGFSGFQLQKDLIPVGPIYSVIYYAAKQHLGAADKIPGPYKHVFSEKGEIEPLLLYDKLNRVCQIAGGAYHIDLDMDFGAHSAGIRD